MVLEIHPVLADQSIGLVVVVQALKIKLGITVLYNLRRTVCVWECMHTMMTDQFSFVVYPEGERLVEAVFCWG